MSFVIAQGVPGLAKPDFGFRLYRNGIAAASTDALTVTEIGDGDYRVSGLPIASSDWITLTWEQPAGVGGFHAYSARDGAPPNLVIPVKEGGLSAADLDLSLYKDGVLHAASLAAVEVGSPGDYRISGWPEDEAGSWLLVWRRAGISFSYGWEGLIPVAPVAPVASAFLAELLELMPHELIAQPGVMDEYGAFLASGAALAIPCNIEGESRLVRDMTGREVVSSHLALCGQANGLSVHEYRYTLPEPFGPPRELIQAVRVDPVSDEVGVLYEVVYLP